MLTVNNNRSTLLSICGVLLLVFQNHTLVVSAQCSVETRANTICFEDQGTPWSTCRECVQANLHSGGNCFGFSDKVCRSISSGCPGCAGCERAVENMLTCQLSTTDFACPIFCDFDRDPGSPTECSSPVTAKDRCFEDRGGTPWSTCRECIQAKLASSSASYCGQFSDFLCPAIETGCPDCRGCEKEVEELLSCNFASASSGSCPFYCWRVFTNSPEDATTQSPTASPTKSPEAVTQSPTASPTKSPEAFVVQSPTTSPVTDAPTKSPGAVTQSPTASPVTATADAPTKSPVTTASSPAPVQESTPAPSPQEGNGTPSPTLNSSTKKACYDLAHLILSSALVVSATILWG
jgi:hypothetical protein